MKSTFKTYSSDGKPLIDSATQQFTLIKSGTLQAVSDKAGQANTLRIVPIGYIPPKPEKNYIIYKMDISSVICPIFAVHLNLKDTSNNWQKLETIHYLSSVRQNNGLCTVYFYSNKRIDNEQLKNYQIYVFDLVRNPAHKIGLNTWNEKGELTFSTFSQPLNIVKTGIINLVPVDVDYTKAPTQSFMDSFYGKYGNMQNLPNDIKEYFNNTGRELYIRQSLLSNALANKGETWLNVKDDVHFISMQNYQKCAVIAQHRADLSAFVDGLYYSTDRTSDSRFRYRMEVHAWYLSAFADWSTNYSRTRSWINDGTLHLVQTPLGSSHIQYDVMGVNNAICFSIQPNFMSTSADGSGEWRANKQKLAYPTKEITPYYMIDVTNLPFPYN